MKPRIVVFAKDPQPGKVKTRLASTLGTSRVVAIYQAMVRDLLNMLMRLTTTADIEIHLDTHSIFFEQFAVPKRMQVGNDLGEKLLHSLRTGLEEGAPSVLVIGSDSPELTEAGVLDMIAREAAVTFGPSPDGGFWGVQARDTHPGMFADVAWSSGSTLADCVRAAEESGFTVDLAGVCPDIDVLADLMRLRERGTMGTHLAQAILQLDGDIVSE